MAVTRRRDPTPFTFGIPLLPRACARDWGRVERLLGLTLTSVLAQTDQDFRIIVAGHDRPATLPDVARLRFLPADWPADAVQPNNPDRGRKADSINRCVLEDGGGLLMWLDADDWVDARLVETARMTIAPHHVAGVIDAGFAVDFQSLRAAPLPHPSVFNEAFHRLCGSSVVLQVCPEHPDPLRRDPHSLLHEHHRVPEVAAARGARVAHLPVAGAYLINTQDNHSELYGPHAGWRRAMCDAVNAVGVPVTEAFAARFGLGLEQVCRASRGSPRGHAELRSRGRRAAAGTSARRSP